MTHPERCCEEDAARQQSPRRGGQRDDRRRRKVIEARNQGDSLIYQVEKDLEDAGSPFAASDRHRIEEAISALRTAITSEDLTMIHQRISALTEAARRFAEAKQQASQPRPDNEGAGTSASDGVVDAEFEEADEKRRRAS